MNKKIYVATFSQNAIEEIEKNGLNIEFNHLCISENLDAENRETTEAAMKKDRKKSKAKMAIAHGPFTEIIPAAIDHKMVELGLERLNQAYDICKSLDIDKMVVHSGQLSLLYFDSWHIEKSKFFWNEFMEDKGDFTIYIENVFEDNPEILKKVVEAVDDPRVRICLDIGHANAAGAKDISIYDWIETLGKYIGHFHIHNNDGKRDTHSSLECGSMDMKKIFQCVEKNCEPDVTFTIESTDCKQSIEWLKNNDYI